MLPNHESLRLSNPVEASDRSFGLVIAGALIVVAAAPLLGGRPLRLWPLPLAALVVGLALLAPSLLAGPNRAWLALGRSLGRVMNPLILGVIFFGVVTPIGLMLRLVGKDVLCLGLDPSGSTYWIERRPPGPAPETMRQQF